MWLVQIKLCHKCKEYTPFEDLVQKHVNYFINNFYIDYVVIVIFWILPGQIRSILKINFTCFFPIF